MNHLPDIENLLDSLQKRALPEGGFLDNPEGHYRVDATAWAILALRSHKPDSPLLAPAQDRLARNQLQDGRIAISLHHPQAFWPTPLAILAWDNSPNHQTAKNKALNFLLQTSGVHWTNKHQAIVGHDTAIPGWPWISDTHSWVPPTAMGLIALRVTGKGHHERATQATRMLLNRQIPEGGWNYGNTLAFGQELRPAPETTGMALSALTGLVPQDQIGKSLAYLEEEIPHLKGPLALGWSLLGLSSWGSHPNLGASWIGDCLSRQKRYGPYDTSLLSLLLIAEKAQTGFLNIYKQTGPSITLEETA